MTTFSVDSASMLAAFKAAWAKFDAGAEASLSELAQAAADRARSSQGYRDVTGNLRSSTGAAVCKGGEAVEMFGFEPALPGADEGVAKGTALARKAASEIGQGPAVAVVAGMPYAAEVEARGQEVLSGALLELQRLSQRWK